MAKFKIGDAVRFAPGVTNDTVGVVPRLLNMDRVYHVSAIKGDSSYVLRETIPGLLFHESWLIKNTEPKMYVRFDIPTIDKVIFNGPATVVFWKDGVRTVVKCGDGETFDPEKGLAMACTKRLFGNTGKFNDTIHRWVNEYAKDVKDVSVEDMRRELHEYCQGRWCDESCVIHAHRSDERCRCGLGKGFSASKYTTAHISDDDIRVFYKWMKEGLKDAR